MGEPERDPVFKPSFVVHVDLDGARHIYRAHGWSYDHDDDPVFETGLERALAFLAEERVSATLFLVAEDLDDPRRRALVERALEGGHEIASHTSTHRLLTQLEPAERDREIAGSRARIADVLGIEVSGFRAPAFAFDRTDLERVSRSGYTYDSSVLPNRTFERRLELDELGPGPFHPLDESALLEIPLPHYRPLPFPSHPSYALVLGEWYFRAGLTRALRSDPLVLLFHLTDFAKPLEGARGMARRVFTISHRSQEAKVDACRRMLRHVARVRTMVETASLSEQTVGFEGEDAR
jgi:peptidoglycan/xylan/chitin deacetylase (PgdA/CDA1 family)